MIYTKKNDDTNVIVSQVLTVLTNEESSYINSLSAIPIIIDNDRYVVDNTYINRISEDYDISREESIQLLESTNNIDNLTVSISDIDCVLDPYSVNIDADTKIIHNESLYDLLYEDILEQVENEELLLEDVEYILESVVSLDEVSTRSKNGYHSRDSINDIAYKYEPNVDNPKSFNNITIRYMGKDLNIPFEDLTILKDFVLRNRKNKKAYQDTFSKAKVHSKAAIGLSKKGLPSNNLHKNAIDYVDIAQSHRDLYTDKIQNPPDYVKKIIPSTLAGELLNDDEAGNTILQAYYSAKRKHKYLQKHKHIKMNDDGTISVTAKGGKFSRPWAFNSSEKRGGYEGNITADNDSNFGNRESRKQQKMDVAKMEIYRDAAKQQNETNTQSNEIIKDLNDKFDEVERNREKEAREEKRKRHIERSEEENFNRPTFKKLKTSYEFDKKRLAIGAGATGAAVGAYAIARKIASLKNIQNKYARKLLMLPPAKRGIVQRIIDKIKKMIVKLSQKMKK